MRAVFWRGQAAVPEERITQERIMTMYKHLSLDERKTIEGMLNSGTSLKKIAARLGRSATTVSREIQKNAVVRRTGAVGQAFNNCSGRMDCEQYGLCRRADCGRSRCKSCQFCFNLCPDFQPEYCGRLKEHPYVCNGCDLRHKCTLEKFVYEAGPANKISRDTLVDSRDGFSLSGEELKRIDGIISPLIKQGQSPYVIMNEHKDEIMLDVATVYRYIKAGLFTAKPIDLPNMVKMKPRSKKAAVKIERACREGRTYRDFFNFMSDHPDTSIVEMDTVLGKKGDDEPVLLTVHFVEAEFMLAFLRSSNSARSVTEIFDRLYDVLGKDRFSGLFQLLLTDNGSEFTNPSALEWDADGFRRTSVYYADPNAPYQKGACENNHILLRRLFPKGKSLKGFTQRDVDEAMSNINSYTRKKLKDRSPFETFSFLVQEPGVLEKLNIWSVPSDKIVLNTSLFKK